MLLRALLREHAVAPSVLEGRPLPLLAGAVGYFGYEAGQMLERLPCAPRPGLGMPDIALFFHDWVLGRSRRTGEAFLSVLGRGPTTALARTEAERTRDRILSVLASFEQTAQFLSDRPRPLEPQRSARVSSVVPSPGAALLASAGGSAVVPREEYLAKIAAAKAHIEAGDAFEICLTHRLEAPFTGDPFALWQELRRTSPSPFAAFLDLPEGAVAPPRPSASSPSTTSEPSKAAPSRAPARVARPPRRTPSSPTTSPPPRRIAPRTR